MIPIKGYKVFNSDFTCRDVKFSEGKTFTFEGKIKLCERGFHFCLKTSDCFTYYPFLITNIVCEVESLGEVEFSNDDSKVCTNKIKIVKRLEWNEVLNLINSGNKNSGNRNSGNDNSGNINSGNNNSGNNNSGDNNSGDINSGDRNSGNRNSGDRNSGDINSGDKNSGNRNSGDKNSGNKNSGNRNSGNINSGDINSGNRNSGDINSGNINSGDINSGNRNSGDKNSGNRNSGDKNSGNRNSGNNNSGNNNSGESNSGYRSSGAFSNNQNPTLFLFNKATNILVKDWEKHEAFEIISKLLNTTWVSEELMSCEEKKENKNYIENKGYLKTISLKESWKNLWETLNKSKKNIFLTLPNFDAEIFEDITGIKTN